MDIEIAMLIDEKAKSKYIVLLSSRLYLRKQTSLKYKGMVIEKTINITNIDNIDKMVK